MAPVKKKLAKRRTNSDKVSDKKTRSKKRSREKAEEEPSTPQETEEAAAVADTSTEAQDDAEHASKKAKVNDESTESEEQSSDTKETGTEEKEPDGASETPDAANVPAQPEVQPESDQKPDAAAKPKKKSWHDRLMQLVEYKKEHGNCLVPTRYKANKQLGKWVHNQREQYKLFHRKTKPGYKKKCSMTEERVKQLEEVGFVWSTERAKKQEEDWQARFQQLKEYREKHGDCMVPHGHAEDPSLYEWVHRQRVQNASMLKSGKEPDSKFKERMNLLKTIGFSFTKQDDVWKQRLEELKKYKEQNGGCEVPTHYSENPVLGRWVVSQRYEFRKRAKGKKSVITQERVDLLNELGFNWAVGKERDRVTWKSRYDELVAFRDQNGTLEVPAEQNPQLHRWCREQKQRLRQVQTHGKDLTKRMGPDRVAALQAIGFAEVTQVVDL